MCVVEGIASSRELVGLGDRVCVDLCDFLQPGEGLLVESFARALFLVHADWLDIDHTAFRPFRINAGLDRLRGSDCFWEPGSSWQARVERASGECRGDESRCETCCKVLNSHLSCLQSHLLLVFT
jgi:hypothetical protein